MPMNILLTGSTGNLGTYLLHTLSFDPNVSHIYCLNRSGSTDTQTRQRSSLRQRGLILPAVSPDFAKITYLTGDLSQPDLALDGNVLKTLRSTETTPLTVLHNAWPVDFNRHFSSFVPQLHSLHHLISLALSCVPRTARFVFISSISAAGNWGALPGARAAVPEALLDDWKVARLGYGQAKLVAERVMAEAARVGGLEGVVVRIGQVAGPVERGLEGSWPRQEWLPSLVRSSAHIGMLPSSLGPMDRVDWVPVDLLSKVVADLVRGEGRAGDDALHGLHNTSHNTNGITNAEAPHDSNTIIEVATPHGTPKPNDFSSPTIPSAPSISQPSTSSERTDHKPSTDVPKPSTRRKPSLFSRHRKSRISNSCPAKQPTGKGTMEYYHVTNPHGTPWSTLLPAVIEALQAPPTFPHPASMSQPNKHIRIVPFHEWVDRLARSAANANKGATNTSSGTPEPGIAETKEKENDKSEQMGISSTRTSTIVAPIPSTAPSRPHSQLHSRQHSYNATTTTTNPNRNRNSLIITTTTNQNPHRNSTNTNKRTSYRLSGPVPGNTADLDTNPAVKLLPFFQTLRDKAVHLPKARAVVLETRATEGVSGTLRGLEAVGGEWMGLWMRQWARERTF